MNFTLKSWSILYKQGKGKGTVTCDNGENASVKISTHGGGLTVGKSKIVKGYGKFSTVHNIGEVFGGYGEGAAHVMWKKDVSLAISGTGKGWDLGINFGEFRITRR